MDLLSAKVEAAAQSLKQKKKVYIVIDGEGECDLSSVPVKGTAYAFQNGSEVPVAGVSTDNDGSEESPSKTKKAKTAETKTENKMAKKAKAKPAKKAAVKKEKKATVEGTPKATTLVLSDAQWKKVDEICDKENTNIRTMVREAIIAKYKL